MLDEVLICGPPSAPGKCVLQSGNQGGYSMLLAARQMIKVAWLASIWCTLKIPMRSRCRRGMAMNPEE